jgi:hypothetical protein
MNMIRPSPPVERFYQELWDLWDEAVARMRIKGVQKSAFFGLPATEREIV